MKLTELIVAIAIFLIASAVFNASLINVRRSVARSEDLSKSASTFYAKRFYAG